MADPWAEPGIQETIDWPSSTVPVTLVGAPGTAAGVTELEAEEAEPVPTPLVAVTVKV